MMTDHRDDAQEPSEVHRLKNHLSTILGFCDLWLQDEPEARPTRADILEVRKAGAAAMALVSEWPRRLR